MFTLPELPYDYSALEPHIDTETMKIHHDKHHSTYVNNLNTALEKYPDLQKKPIEDIITHLNDIPEEIRTTVRNNGGGHINHTMFWESMKPTEPNTEPQEPTGDLTKKISDTFESFALFKEKFNQAGVSRFGSGWAWLVLKNGNLEILSTANQDNPLTDGFTPLLGCDVWEHAYYLKYQNKRPDYLSAWWNVVNWDTVSLRFNS